MKSFTIALFSIVFCLIGFMSTAHAGGEIFGSGYYLDDYQQTQVAPVVGIHAWQPLDQYVHALSVDGYLDEGHLNLPADVNGNVPAGYFTELKADVTYAGLVKDLKISAGAGWVSNAQYYRQFDDYVHLTVAYKLW